MDAVFTLNYPEYAVAECLSKLLPKKEGYSLNIPLNRQQKGFDLLVYSSNSGKSATIQVKGSRSYKNEPPKRKTEKRWFNYGLWYNNFNYQDGAADFYILFGLFPESDIINKPLNQKRDRKTWWSSKILMFQEQKMKDFLKDLADTKSGNPAHSFGLEFDNDSEDIYITRGSPSAEPLLLNKFLIENSIKSLQDSLR